MTTYPIEIRRCQHVKVNGTQCGSPALKGENVCHFHQQCTRMEEVEFYGDELPYGMGQMPFPVFEDATSIQLMLRQVTQLLLQKRIAHKTAGLVLYALQIASSNVKSMKLEMAQPTEVVVDKERMGETGLWETQWSTSEDDDQEEDETADDSWSGTIRACEERRGAPVRNHGGSCSGGSRCEENHVVPAVVESHLNVERRDGSTIRRLDSFAPMGLDHFSSETQGLRRGLYSCAASRLGHGKSFAGGPPGKTFAGGGARATRAKSQAASVWRGCSVRISMRSPSMVLDP
jgi:hypothetical protein